MKKRIVILCLLVIFTSDISTCLSQSWQTYGRNEKHNNYIPGEVGTRRFGRLWQHVVADHPDRGGIVTAHLAVGSTAVVDNGQVFISRGRWAIESLSLDTGELMWRKEFDNSYRNISPPAIANGRVYANLYGHSQSSNSPDPALVALNARSGFEIFRTEHPGQSSSGSQPVIHDGSVFMPGGLYGGMDRYDAATGEHQWFGTVKQDYDWAPAVFGDNVFYYESRTSGSFGTLVGRSIETGEVAILIVDETAQRSNQHTLMPVFDDNGIAYVDVDEFGIGNTRIVAFDTNSGSVAWETNSLLTRFGPLEMATDGNSLFAMSTWRLQEFDSETGASVRSWDFEDSLEESIILSDSHVMVSTSTETISINRETGEIDWTIPLSGKLSLGEGVLLVSNNLSVTALKEFLVGDVDQNGVVDVIDISHFIDVLVGNTYRVEADINADDVVDFLDISGFIALLIS